MLVGVMSNRVIIDGVPRDSLRNKYVSMLIEVMGVSVMLIPTVAKSESKEVNIKRFIDETVNRVDMIMLTGDESNIQPELYGANHQESIIDPARDNVVFKIIEKCCDVKKPLLGICRGIQEINVAFGGTLYPDLKSIGKYHIEDVTLPRDEQYRPVHTVNLQAGGLLHKWYEKNTLPVNSLHNQGLKTIGKDLFVEAVSEDGLVEAISYTKYGNNILGVQWHPEWHADNEVNSNRLIHSFISSIYVDNIVKE